ncbi:MAG: hypothetical protein ABF876_06355 [Acetobacter aceti]|uniref:hypothetical protein n=1 Tax=Acetobacter aceti TaxID=435 RepID=UPI00165711B3|nr:hypothetical protein [Acetobacter aceti]
MIPERQNAPASDETEADNDEIQKTDEKSKRKWLPEKISFLPGKVAGIRDDVMDSAVWLKDKTISLKEAAIIRKYQPYIEGAISKVAASTLFEIISDELIIAKVANIVIDHLPLHMRLVLRKTGMDRLLVATLAKVKTQIIQQISAARAARKAQEAVMVEQGINETVKAASVTHEADNAPKTPDP